ncbi:phospholipid-translocating P-type ATPase, partial [Neocallimastix californiae]
EIRYPALQIKKFSNYVKTTKYTILTFIPLNLWQQFHRLSNCYFLLGMIATMTGYSSINPISQAMPLIFVLGVTAIKDAFSDYNRHKQDKKVNLEYYTIYRDKKLQRIYCQDINPGDIIILEKDDKIPADCLLMSSSSEENECYIETSDLDGETNLKHCVALPQLSFLRCIDEFSEIECIVKCEPPNDSFSSFDGTIKLHKIDNFKTNAFGKELAICSNQILFRGSVLRNTNCIYAMSLYTGKDTRIFLNSKQTGLKFSSMEQRINLLLVIIILVNILLLAYSISMDVKYKRRLRKNRYNKFSRSYHWYLDKQENHSLFDDSIKSFFSFFGLYSYLIPLSIFVTLEAIRVLQTKFMEWDHQLLGKRTYKTITQVEWVPMKANSFNLGDDLGRVEFIFSDKTGTLTQNCMKLSKWFINGQIFDGANDPKCLSKIIHAQKMIDYVKEYCRAITTCNTVMPILNHQNFHITYESQSPDEVALIQGLSRCGVRLLTHTKHELSAQVFGEYEKYTIEILTEFSSERKRMSILVKDQNNEYTLYCKGADDVILERLSNDPNVNSEQLIHSTKTALKEFGQSGLRCLVIAMHKFNEEEVKQILEQYKIAENSIGNRTQNINKVVNSIERDLKLLGVTAIEDQLQDNVPETIDYLIHSGIKFWLLTGDNQDTAINIGTSSKLLTKDMNVMIINAHSASHCGRLLDKQINLMKERGEWGKLHFTKPINDPVLYKKSKKESMSILQKKFVELGIRCHVVICCRATPSQKAKVVNIIKTNLNKMTLAIGDGANDVAMIQKAHIGIGIIGREGAQAMRASDYAILEFKFLKTLLCIHGRYSLLRVSKMIYHSFYKNFVFTLIQFFYITVSYWSGTSAYESYFRMSFNTFYTTVFIYILACSDRDVSTNSINKIPELYRQINNKTKGYFTGLKSLGWLIDAIWHSIGKNR